MANFEFPTETIDLPSKGLVYPEKSPLRSGQIEIKYMTAKEEDILSSQNLIKKGVVLDRLFDSLIVTKGVKQADLVVGDKNAVMIAARVLAYGAQYPATVETDDGPMEVTFDLSDVKFEIIDDEDSIHINSNSQKENNSKEKVLIIMGNDTIVNIQKNKK